MGLGINQDSPALPKAIDITIPKRVIFIQEDKKWLKLSIWSEHLKKRCLFALDSSNENDQRHTAPEIACSVAKKKPEQDAKSHENQDAGKTKEGKKP